MGRYLKAAFWLGLPVPGLGRLPVNALGLLGFGILGVGHPGFWLLGLGLEAAWLYGATSSERFRALTDAGEEMIEEETTEQRRQALVAGLAPGNRERLARLEKKSARALALQRDAGVSEIMQEMNGESFDKLTWYYLKLLVARENLQALGDASMRRDLSEQVGKLERELGGRLTPALRDSKEATLKILRQRLAHVDRREESLAELDSDLTRIEAQIDLAADNAGLRGQQNAVSSEIHFVSQFLDEAIYGAAGNSITALDETYRAAPPRKVAE